LGIYLAAKNSNRKEGKIIEPITTFAFVNRLYYCFRKVNLQNGETLNRLTDFSLRELQFFSLRVHAVRQSRLQIKMRDARVAKEECATFDADARRA
jgi:hypothetical protein